MCRALLSACHFTVRCNFHWCPLQENTGRINSLDFHRREDLLVTAGEDDSVHLYNINSGTVEKTVFSRKYGVAHIRFTHHPYSVVYASNKASAPGPVFKRTLRWKMGRGMQCHVIMTALDLLATEFVHDWLCPC